MAFYGMSYSARIRGWRQAGTCAVLCLAISGFVAAQSDSTAPAQKSTASSNAKTPSNTTSHTSTANAGSKTPASKSARTATQKSAAQKASSHATAHSATRSASAANSKTARSRRGSRTVATKKRGQQVIASDRAREIQTALIREHYLSGEATGVWDSATQAAMQRYQTDQGWQSKTIPDSRALIKLGLGPNQDHLLNPESAMTTAPVASAADPKSAAKAATPAEGVPQR